MTPQTQTATVEMIQYTGENFDECKAFVGDKLREPDYPFSCIYIDTLNGVLDVQEMQFICKYLDGSFRVFSDYNEEKHRVFFGIDEDTDKFYFTETIPQDKDSYRYGYQFGYASNQQFIERMVHYIKLHRKNAFDYQRVADSLVQVLENKFPNQNCQLQETKGVTA